MIIVYGPALSPFKRGQLAFDRGRACAPHKGWAIMTARFASPDGGELVGYTDRWSVAPGERIQLMASATASPVTVQMVRLRHGDPNPAGPGLRAEPVRSAVDGE